MSRDQRDRSVMTVFVVICILAVVLLFAYRIYKHLDRKRTYRDFNSRKSIAMTNSSNALLRRIQEDCTYANTKQDYRHLLIRCDRAIEGYRGHRIQYAGSMTKKDLEWGAQVRDEINKLYLSAPIKSLDTNQY